MAAATELFRERGFRETSLGDIGAAAGVSGPAIYRYFDSKGELLSVLIEEAAVIWRGTVDEVLNEDMPPLVTLELLIDAAIVLQLRNGNLRDVFVKEYRSLDDAARRRVARIERVRMAEWVHLLCEVRPGLGEDEARAAVTMLDGMLRSITTLDQSDPELLARVMKDMVFGGLLAVGIPRPDAILPTTARDGMTDVAAGAGEQDEPSEEAFRREVLAFLEATLPAKGDEASGVISFGGSGLSRSVAYQRQLADAGLAGITWPAAYGGRGLPGRYQRIYDREAKAFRVPPRSLEIGLGMCGPTLLVHASEEQKRTFIPPMLRGEHVWCELFSEPGAGSDLSSVQTRARRDGDEFVLQGQKVWTSGAQHSDYAACLVRTDPARPKREGITMLIVDMHVPGITVRPLRQMTGESHFNEVFLDEVRVPVANVVGEVNDGWRVARTMLAFERQALGNMGGGGGGKGGFAAVAAEAKRRDLAHRPVLRDRLVQLRIRQMVLRHLTAYLLVKAKGGDGAAASVLKLAMAQLVQESALVAVETAGMHAIAWTDDDPDGGRWSDQLLSSQSASIGGGTNQIVRNVIAERVLGLPRDAEGDLMPGDLDGRGGNTRATSTSVAGTGTTRGH